MLTQDRLKELFTYDPETGNFKRNVYVSPNAQVGDVAGSLKKHGGVILRIDEQDYQAHRLAFLYMTGEWPKNCVDHIDGVRSNNKWSNLRDCTLSENQHNRKGPQSNSSTGYLGVTYQKARGKYLARIKINGKAKHIGSFYTSEDAYEAYLAEKRRIHSHCTI